MTTTPVLWRSLSQVNTTDIGAFQGNARIAFVPLFGPNALGSYVVVWGDDSRVYSPSPSVIVGQIYDSNGNKVGGEVVLSSTGMQASENFKDIEPAVTVLANGNIAVAVVRFYGDPNGTHHYDLYVRVFTP